MCPPYCNECISLLKFWLVNASRRRGILQRRRGASCGEKLCVKVPSLLSEALTRGTQGRMAFGALSLDTGLVSPLYLLTPTPSYNIPPTKHSSATPSHLFFTVILTSMNCPPPPAPPLPLFTLSCLAFSLALHFFSWQSRVVQLLKVILKIEVSQVFSTGIKTK